MRVFVAIVAVVLTGCTVTINGGESASPSEFLEDYRFAEIAASVPGGDSRAPGSGESSAGGLTTYEGRKYHRKHTTLREAEI